MSWESIQGDGSFVLKPGGAMEEALPTDLGQGQYSQSSGITNTGRLIRMPGKRFQQQFADRVLQIAGFGGAVIIQHGSTIIMYPDACAVSPTDDDDANAVLVPAALPTVLNKNFAHVVTPNPWAAHPNKPRDIPYGNLSPSTPIEFFDDVDVEQTDYTLTAGAANYFYRHYDVAAYCNAFDTSQWSFSAEITDELGVGNLDLTAYSPTVYARAELIGNSNGFNPDGSVTTNVDNYSYDVTKHLGKIAQDIELPLPAGGVPLVWFEYFNADNTAHGAFNVDITNLRLTKFGPPNS